MNQDTTGPNGLAESQRLAYQEVCRSYHAIADFRAKLLGLLPFASAGIFLLLDVDLSKLQTIAFDWRILPAIGLFGFVVTFGLLRYELRGIQRCLALIDIGCGLEQELGLKYGQFSQRPDRIGTKIGTESAGRIVYPAVLAAYSYLFLAPSSVWVGKAYPQAEGFLILIATHAGYAAAALVFFYFWRFDWSRYDPSVDWESQISQKLPPDHPKNKRRAEEEAKRDSRKQSECFSSPPH